MPTMDLSLVAFGCLGLAIASLWVFEGRVVWTCGLLIAVALALASHLMDRTGLGISLVAGSAIYIYYRRLSSRALKAALAVVMSMFTLGLFGHLFPGFQDKVL